MYTLTFLTLDIFPDKIGRNKIKFGNKNKNFEIKNRFQRIVWVIFVNV